MLRWPEQASALRQRLVECVLYRTLPGNGVALLHSVVVEQAPALCLQETSTTLTTGSMVATTNHTPTS